MCTLPSIEYESTDDMTVLNRLSNAATYSETSDTQPFCPLHREVVLFHTLNLSFVGGFLL